MPGLVPEAEVTAVPVADKAAVLVQADRQSRERSEDSRRFEGEGMAFKDPVSGGVSEKGTLGQGHEQHGVCLGLICGQRGDQAETLS